MQFAFSDILKILPELLLVLLAILVVLGDLLPGDASENDRFREAAQTTALGLGLVFIVVLLQGGFLINRLVPVALQPEDVGNVIARNLLQLLRNLQSVTVTENASNVLLNGALMIDPLLMIGRLLFTGAALLTALLAQDYGRSDNPGEFFGFLIFATVGLNLMAGAGELITLYLALELASVSLYIMAGYFKREPKSSEAGIKYYIFGALSSGILLYGLSLLYGFTAASGVTDPTSLKSIAQAVAAGQTSPLLLLSLIFIIAGMGYKLAVVPFHSWSPDVYQGAPTPVTAFLSTASKTAGFMLLLRILIEAFGPLTGSASLGSTAATATSTAVSFGGWSSMLALIAFLTMTFGNLAAMNQTNAKRMLAYSSIAHAGFLLIGMAAVFGRNGSAQNFSSFGMTSLVYYLITYTVTNLGVFGALAAVSRIVGGDEISDLYGLHRRNLPLAVIFVIFVLSLAGIPPLSGFWAKFFVFQAGWEAGAIWLVVAALLNTVVSLYYYLRLLKAMFFAEPLDDRKISVPRGTNFALIVTGLLTLALGLAPQFFLPAVRATERMAMALLGS